MSQTGGVKENIKKEEPSGHLWRQEAWESHGWGQGAVLTLVCSQGTLSAVPGMTPALALGASVSPENEACPRTCYSSLLIQQILLGRPLCVRIAALAIPKGFIVPYSRLVF